MVDELNKVKYVGSDFFSLFDDLLSRLQTKFPKEFNDFALSGLGMMLVDIVAFALDQQSFQLDRRATDAYLATARTRKAVSRLTRQLGYKMGAAIASSVDLQVAVKNPQMFDIPITKGTQFKGPNGLVFEAAVEVVFPPSSGPTNFLLVPAYEGQTFVESFVSDGKANQVFELRKVPDQSSVVSGTVVVLVDGAPFSEVEFLTFAKSNQVEVGYNDTPPSIRFGDGVIGNIPTTGATIQVTYVASRGRSGQVAKDTIQDTVAPLVVNFTRIQLIINNQKGSVGGDDPEDIEHAKAFGGRVWKTRDAAVTRQDYESLAGSFAHPLFGRVAVAQAISSRSAAEDLTLQNFLTEISTAVSPIKPAVDSQIADGREVSSDIGIQLSTINTELGEIATTSADILEDVESAITSSRACKNKSLEISVDAQEVQGLVIDSKSAVDAITLALTSQLTQADKDALKSFSDRIGAQVSSIITASSTIDSSATEEISTLGGIRDKIHKIGVSTDETDSSLLVISTASGTISAENVELLVVLDVIEDAVADETSVVGEAIAGINAHMDKILAADCQANLITVPILAKDAGGFYAAPTLSLINALQESLDSKKEASQTVVVTSGAKFLVSAVITVRIGVRKGVSSQQVKTAVEGVMDSVLRGRDFGASLWIFAPDGGDGLFNAFDTVAGIAFANVTINGHLDTDGTTVLTSKLDVNGNLIVSESEVVTKGIVTVLTPEVLS